MKKTLAVLAVSMIMTGCSGIRQTNNQFTTHAEAFRIVGFVFPEDDQAKARSLVPKGGTITDVSSSPADWTSFVGFFGNLIGFSSTQVSGTK